MSRPSAGNPRPPQRIRPVMTRNQYCWRFGVLGWGLTTAVAFAIVMSTSRDDGILKWLTISLLVFPASGYLWGLFMWRFVGPGKREAMLR